MNTAIEQRPTTSRWAKDTISEADPAPRAGTAGHDREASFTSKPGARAAGFFTAISPWKPRPPGHHPGRTTRAMRIVRPAAAVLVLAAALFASGAPALHEAQAAGNGPRHGPPDATITSWDQTTVRALQATAGLAGPDHFLFFGLVHLAMYDAVVTVKGGYEPFALHQARKPGASAEAAAATAANRVIKHHLPAGAAIADAALVASLAAIADGPGKTDGIAIGEAAAAAVLALPANKGILAHVPYTVPNPPIPGAWVPTPPPAQILGSYMPNMTPLSLRRADQFRPKAPPALDRRAWAQQYNETKELGSATSSVRTPEQTLAARFWGESPAFQQHGALRKLVTDRGLDILRAARLMAMTNTVVFDAAIACFDAKYQYAFWRPITAIRNGDSDGNPGTVADPAWQPLIATPNHPEYPSAHSCITPGMGLAVARFLGTHHIDLTIPSLTGLGDRHYDTVKDLETEVGNARIWGGIHFRAAVESGTRIGRRVANQVLARHFRPLDDK